MGLPAIAPYELPAGHELPPTRAPWTPSAARAALLVHDMQGYFVRAFTPGASPIAPAIANIRRLREHCARVGVPVFYTAQPGRQEPRPRGLQRDFWGPGMTDAPEDQAIVAELAPLPGQVVLTKWRYSAFQRSDFGEQLAAAGRDQLIVTGIFAHIGCLMTAADAFMRDIEPFLAADALADFSRERHDQALEYAAGRCAVPLTTDQLIAQLSHKGLTTMAAVLTLDEIRQELAALLRIDPSEILEDDNLLDHGLDSMRLMQLVDAWQARGIQAPFPRLAERPELLHWAAVLREEAAGAPPAPGGGA